MAITRVNEPIMVLASSRSISRLMCRPHEGHMRGTHGSWTISNPSCQYLEHHQPCQGREEQVVSSMRYLIAFIVGCHGFTCIPFGIPVPVRLKEWKGSSWFLGNALMGNRLKARVLVLHVMAGIVILACAVGIAFARSVPGLWRLIAIAGGILSLGAFAVFCWFQESLGKAQGDAAQSNCD